MVHLKCTPTAVMLAPIQMSPDILKVNVNKFLDSVSVAPSIRCKIALPPWRGHFYISGSKRLATKSLFISYKKQEQD